LKALGDDGWVFDKGGKMNTALWAPLSSFKRAVACGMTNMEMRKILQG
jgi:hypothetical protein